MSTTPDVAAKFCHLQAAFLAYLPSLTCAQIKIYLLLNSLCGDACQWIAISTRNITGPLELQRENALLAIRGLLAAGLIQKQDQGTKRKAWYRTTPEVPLPEKNWMSQLTEMRILIKPAESGPDTGPEIWNGNRTSLPPSGTETGPVSMIQTGRKTGPPIVQTEDVSAPASLYDINSILPVSKSVRTTDRPADEKEQPENPREAEIESVVRSKLAGRLSQTLRPALRGKIAAALNGADIRQFEEVIDQRQAKITSLALLEHLARDCAETQDAWRASRKPDEADPTADRQAAASLAADPKRLKLARKKAELQHPLSKIERMALEL